MEKSKLLELLESVQQQKTTVEGAYEELKNLPFADLDFAKIDNHREIRTGYPEVIYGEGKTSEQLKKIVSHMLLQQSNILITRCSSEKYKAILEVVPNANYNEIGRTVTIYKDNLYKDIDKNYIAIVSAGTSDLPVVEEAYETAKILGNKVVKITDVGVAGIHRLFNKLEEIRKAKVIIVVAGMEGALASVIGGLVDKPIIAVPTSVGYGANLGGIAALLSMLNSCASGVSVVNIDNGFGAAYNASIINKLD